VRLTVVNDISLDLKINMTLISQYLPVLQFFTPGPGAHAARGNSPGERLLKNPQSLRNNVLTFHRPSSLVDYTLTIFTFSGSGVLLMESLIHSRYYAIVSCSHMKEV
jgi:hypothetical protein